MTGGGGDDEPAAAAIPEGNLTTNPSFERNSSGWDFFQSDLAREQASDAPDGENVARVTLSGSSGGVFDRRRPRDRELFAEGSLLHGQRLGKGDRGNRRGKDLYLASRGARRRRRGLPLLRVLGAGVRRRVPRGSGDPSRGRRRQGDRCPRLPRGPKTSARARHSSSMRSRLPKMPAVKVVVTAQSATRDRPAARQTRRRQAGANAETPIRFT